MPGDDTFIDRADEETIQLLETALKSAREGRIVGAMVIGVAAPGRAFFASTPGHKMEISWAMGSWQYRQHRAEHQHELRTIQERQAAAQPPKNGAARKPKPSAVLRHARAN